MSTFQERCIKRTDELEALYRSLYGDNGLDALFTLMERKHSERKNELRALDETREQTPDWYLRPEMLGLTMYSDLFAGGIHGIEEHMDYLRKMQITYLHLMPFLKTPEKCNDGGFAVSDYGTVNPSLGTNDDVERLADTLRKSGISLCMDFVMNHTADDHEWARKAKEGEKRYQDMYICFPDRTVPDQYERTVPEVFPATAPGNFTWCAEMNKWVFTSFYPSQWDLNYRNPEVFLAIVSSMLDWANRGVEVFRLDAVPYIWKELGTCCRNLPEVHSIVRMIRLVFEIAAPAVILKGEVVMAPRELAAYFGTKEHPECHILYGVSLMVNIWGALSSQDARLLESQTEAFLSLPDNCHFVNYVRCHDDIGWGFDEDEERRLGIDPLQHKIFQYRFYEGTFPGSYARGQLYNYDPASLDARSCGTAASLTGIEEAIQRNDMALLEKAISRMKLIHAVIFAMKGFPLINSGDEIAQLNNYEYVFNPDKRDDSRYVHRSQFRWDLAERCGDSSTLQGRIFSFLQELKAARLSSPAFDPDAGVTTWHPHNSRIFALRRQKDGHDVLAVFSFSDSGENCHFDFFMGKYRDILSGRTVEPGKGFSMEPHSFMYLENITHS